MVGADVAKNKHVARAQDWRGIEYGERLVFSNSREGVTKLITWISTMMHEHGKEKVIFGVEPTGHYWLPTAQFLRSHGIRFLLVNPMHVKPRLRALLSMGYADFGYFSLWDESKCNTIRRWLSAHFGANS